MTQSTDIVLKNLGKDNGRFADVFNGALFHGQTVLSPEHLKECDSDVSQIIRSKGHSSSYRWRPSHLLLNIASAITL